MFEVKLMATLEIMVVTDGRKESRCERLFEFADSLDQWFPNCGTRTTSGMREPFRWFASNLLKLLSYNKYLKLKIL